MDTRQDLSFELIEKWESKIVDKKKISSELSDEEIQQQIKPEVEKMLANEIGEITSGKNHQEKLFQLLDYFCRHKQQNNCRKYGCQKREARRMTHLRMLRRCPKCQII